jgi:hypothetical protein
MTSKLTVAKRPCGSCPYRKDVPSGVWEKHEYDKLVAYDEITPLQPPARFDCHQRDGNLCAGWVACHGLEGPTGLLALRFLQFNDRLADEVYEYETDVPVFGSGAEAREHGLADIEEPGIKALKLMHKLKPVVGKGASK